MEKTIDKKSPDKISSDKYFILAKKKTGKLTKGVHLYKTEDDAHRHWKNLCRFVPMQMEKYISYTVEKI